MAMRSMWWIGVLMTGMAMVRAAASDDPRQPPNIIFFLADDLGWTDLACFESAFYETPALDKLAATGMKFPNAYASCPVCSPSRASIMTGKYPARLGLTAHIGDAQPWQYRRNTPLTPPAYVDHLPPSEVTLAEALHAAGYATLIAGKWHLGLQDQHWPEYQGFDVNFGGYSQGGPFGGKQYFSPYGNPRLSDGPPGEHLTDRLAAETIRFIEARRHKPFFAYVPFYDVHVPLVAKEELRQKYERKRNPFGETKAPIWGFDGGVRVRQVQEHAVYAAMVEAMDQAVGRILETVERLGLSERTIVVFTSDNGGLSTGDVGISPDQGWPTSNLPLRAGKGWLYEGGIRVPLIIRAPSVTPAGAVNETVVTGTDFLPTLLDLAGLSTDRADLDGVSLVPALRGDKQERGPVFWHYPHYGNQGGRPGAVVREGPWKLIRWYGEPNPQLFDLAKDIGETKDLAPQEPEIRDRLFGLLDSWLKSMDAKFPTPREATAEAPPQPK